MCKKEEGVQRFRSFLPRKEVMYYFLINATCSVTFGNLRFILFDSARYDGSTQTIGVLPGASKKKMRQKTERIRKTPTIFCAYLKVV